MKVIKLGGSLLETGQIFDCLKTILKSHEPIVVVCGGGEFANYIRDAQVKWHFDDVSAHKMAILAMQQTAIMCQNLQPEFVIASSISEIKKNHFVIWSPNITYLNTAEIPATWDITSDSLAVWLTKKLDAKELVIVKSCEIDSKLTHSELTNRGILDKAFCDFLKNTSFNVTVTSAENFLTS